MSDDKRNKSIYINWKNELLIWLVFILICSIFFFIFNIKKQANSNEFSIFMPDVDGLIVGSPVRTMGIEIGNVTKIKPIKDEVFIKFIITEDNIKIPRGTVATVEFSGMAGSKSLELYLPDKNTYIDSSVPIISVQSPKRLHDAAGLLNEMFKKIGNIIIVSTRFGNKLSGIKFVEKKTNSNSTREFINFTNQIIDKSQESADNLGRKLENVKRRK